MWALLIIGWIATAPSQKYIKVTQWIDSLDRKPLSFKEWKREIVSLPFSIGRVYSSLFEKNSSILIDILINARLYPEISTSVERYIRDLELSGYVVEVDTTEGGTPEDIREHLKNRLLEGLAGAVFIGDIPTAWFQFIDDWNDSHTRDEPLDIYEEFPCDLFYQDLDGLWEDNLKRLEGEDSLIPGNDGIYDTHSGAVTPEIWVGRIDASNLTYESQIGLYKRYFERNHRYRNGGLGLNDSALVYIDNDWYEYFHYEGLNRVYKEVTVFKDLSKTDAPDYKNRLSDSYLWIALFCHSSPWIHCFDPYGENPTYVYNHQIWQLKPRASFYNLYACSNARFVEENSMAAWYVLVDSSGLAAVGSSKMGGMWNSKEFHLFLSTMRLGDAFMTWWGLWMRDGIDNTERSYFYGMTLLGDPTLKAKPETLMAIAEKPIRNREYLLNFPNPSKGKIEVRFQTPFSGRAAIRLYSTSGDLVAELMEVDLERGNHRAILGSKKIPSGVYFLSLEIERRRIGRMRKLVLLR